jgi:hypothetical protein
MNETHLHHLKNVFSYWTFEYISISIFVYNNTQFVYYTQTWANQTCKHIKDYANKFVSNKITFIQCKIAEVIILQITYDTFKRN